MPIKRIFTDDWFIIIINHYLCSQCTILTANGWNGAQFIVKYTDFMKLDY